MTKKPAEFTSNYFSISNVNRQVVDGAEYVRLHASDRFGSRRHAFERRAFAIFTKAMESYLRKHPHLDFMHPKNPIPRIVYLPPALKSWAAYMPGGFATFHVHNPDRTHLHSGKKLDYLTKNLFRHSSDAIGLRSRAYAMAWYLQGHFASHSHISWLSIASGTGQPAYDAAQLFNDNKDFHLCDLDEKALAYAVELADEYAINPASIHTHRVDVTDGQRLAALLAETQPNIIEAMGLFEYLDDETATTLLRRLKVGATKGSVLVFTNMHAGHPQLQLHKRGLGWPGVIPRTVEQTRALIKAAGYPDSTLTVLQPDDDVYAVYGLIL